MSVAESGFRVSFDLGDESVEQWVADEQAASIAERRGAHVSTEVFRS